MGPRKRGRDLRCAPGPVKATAAGAHAIGAQMVKDAQPQYARDLKRLRAECGDWPGVIETTSWGNPTFEAGGKAFAVLDRYQGHYCIWVRCRPDRREALLDQKGYVPAPYDRKKQAVCRILDKMDWKKFSDVLRESYESVMPG